MDFIENLLSHMSSTFNRESILPKQAEIAEDETFKWRALKNNQFASRTKNSQTKRSNKNISPTTLAEDLNASNTANEIVIEIANGISNAEIQEALIQQSSSVECQIHNVAENVSEPYAESKENQEASHKDDASDQNEKQNDKKIKLPEGKAEIVSTSNLFKHMSSTFNSTREISIKNITELSGAKEMESYKNSDIVNLSHRKSAKKQLKTVRRSNRLKQDNVKYDHSYHEKPCIARSPQNDLNDLDLSNDSHKSELSQDTSAMKSILDDQKSSSIDCESTEHVVKISAPDERVNLKIRNMSKCNENNRQKKISFIPVFNQPKAVSNNQNKDNCTKIQKSSHSKRLNMNRRLTANNKQKNLKKFDSKQLSSSKERPVRQNYESTLNAYSKVGNMARNGGRLSRPIKLSAKILANKKLRHGFELQNSARLGCTSKVKPPSQPSSEPTILPETEHQETVSNVESSPSKIDNPEIQQFLCEIKRLHLTNHKSPETDRNLSKSQIQQLMKLKERHFRSLGLLSTQAFRKSQKGQKVAFESNITGYFDAKNEKAISKFEHKKETLIPTSSKRKTFEKCLCEKRFPLFTAKTQNRMQCTAIDDVDGKLIKCGNKLEGKTQNFLRPSLRSSYQLLCGFHCKRFRRHGCCPRCGIYCTQGKFAICSRRHLFHTKCAEKCESGLHQRLNTKLLLKCPHCGVKENSEKLKTEIQLLID